MVASSLLRSRKPAGQSWQQIILPLFVIILMAQLSSPALAQNIGNKIQGKKDPSLSLDWIRKHLGTKSPYPHEYKRTSPLRDTPEGYELVQIHLLNRHGTRYPSSSKIVTYKKLAEKLGKTTLPGYKWLNKWPGDVLYPLAQGNLLTPKGDADLYQIGHRFGVRYKDFIDRYPYDANTYDIRSSSKPRCTQSAYSFFEGFLEGRHTNVKINGIKNDKLKRPPFQPVAFSTLPAGLDKEIAIQDSCPRWVNKVKEDAKIEDNRNIYQKKFLPQLAERLTGLLSSPTSQVNITTKDVENIYGICSFEVAIYNNDKTFCELLKNTSVGSEPKNSSFVNLEISGDLDDYYVFGPVVPFNRHPGCMLGTTLTNSIEKALTSDPVVPIEDDELGPSYYRGNFKFGHSETVFFLSTFLGLHNQTGTFLTGDMTPDQFAQREFHNSKISPFSANVAFEVFRSKSSNETKTDLLPKGLVRLLVNEEPALIPGCGSAYFCEWNTFKQALQKAGAGCNYDVCCALDPSDSLGCLSVDPITRK